MSCIIIQRNSRVNNEKEIDKSHGALWLPSFLGHVTGNRSDWPIMRTHTYYHHPVKSPSSRLSNKGEDRKTENANRWIDGATSSSILEGPSGEMILKFSFRWAEILRWTFVWATYHGLLLPTAGFRRYVSTHSTISRISQQIGSVKYIPL